MKPILPLELDEPFNYQCNKHERAPLFLKQDRNISYDIMLPRKQ